MRVLGIDPGLNITGYGVLDQTDEQIRVIEAGVVRSLPNPQMEARLKEIGNEIHAIIEQLQPNVMVVEELYSHYEHPVTAIIMAHVRGVILLSAAQERIPVVSYSVTRIKKSLTGNGRASKAQVQKMVASTLCLAAIPEPPDAADALAIALCHCRAVRHHGFVEV